MLCLKTGGDFFNVIENTNPPKFRGIGTQHYFCPVTLFKTFVLAVIFIQVLLKFQNDQR